MSYADTNLLEWLGDRRSQLDDLQYEALAWAYHAAILTYPSSWFSRRPVWIATEAALNAIQGSRRKLAQQPATEAEYEAVQFGKRVARHALRELQERELQKVTQ